MNPRTASNPRAQNFALAAHVNSFTGFFCALSWSHDPSPANSAPDVADQAPFILSIFTFLIVGITLVGDFKGTNPLMSRPKVELAWLALLTLFWLCQSRAPLSLSTRAGG